VAVVVVVVVVVVVASSSGNIYLLFCANCLRVIEINQYTMHNTTPNEPWHVLRVEVRARV